MHNSYFNKYLIYFFLFCFTSCNKFLDEKSDKKLAIMETLSDLQGLLDNDVTMNQGFPQLGEVSADDYYLSEDGYNLLNGVLPNNAMLYTWQGPNRDFLNDWSVGYQGVYPANYSLEKLNTIERSITIASNWDNVKGSALFFRAYRYLSLIWEYGLGFEESSADVKPGIVLRLDANFNTPSKRSTVKECYEQILQDAKESVNYLPNYPLHVMRPSKTAAYALLSRAYLSMRNYDSALFYSNLTLTLKQELLDYNNTNEVNASSMVPFKPFNNEIIFAAYRVNSFSTTSPTIATVDSLLYDSYTANDLRKSVFFTANPNFGGFTFKGHYTGEQFLNFSGLAVDEIYLIKAECLARLGEVNDAMQVVNTLLEKRFESNTFIPLTANDAAEALTIILLERRKELLMRNIRWSDIKRLNIEGFNIEPRRLISGQTYLLPANSLKYALPLPVDLIEQTGMEQN